MYHSTLLVNVGDNPDQPRPGRLWLRNAYRVHQRLCMAFQTETKKKDDPDFLKPYNPKDDLDRQQVHVARNTDGGFLYRVDAHPGGNVAIIVQSAKRPDWNYAFHNAPSLLAADPEVKPFNPKFAQEQRFRFRLKANPTKKIDTKTKDDGIKRNGKRVPVKYDELKDWLIRHAAVGGFALDEDSIALQTGYVYINASHEGKGRQVFAVRYDGLLNVTDQEKFQQTICQGIGTSKGFGFGLLSVAPVR